MSIQKLLPADNWLFAAVLHQQQLRSGFWNLVCWNILIKLFLPVTSRNGEIPIPLTRGYPHDGAFGGGVAPGFVVAGEDAEVTAPDELVVIDAEQRIGRNEKFGVENHFDAILN